MIDVEDLIEKTLSDQFTDSDPFDLIEIEHQAEMFRELVTLIGKQKRDKNLTLFENRSEWYLEIHAYIELSLINTLHYKLGAEAA
jgi:hypothetical protein